MRMIAYFLHCNAIQRIKRVTEFEFNGEEVRSIRETNDLRHDLCSALSGDAAGTVETNLMQLNLCVNVLTEESAQLLLVKTHQNAELCFLVKTLL